MIDEYTLFFTPFCISLSFVNCWFVIIQGKGFPDVNTRMMVRSLWSTLQIPILALVDADPHGNFKCFTLFILDAGGGWGGGGVTISPPKYESLLKQFNSFMNLAFLSLECEKRFCSWQVVDQVKTVLCWINFAHKYFLYLQVLRFSVCTSLVQRYVAHNVSNTFSLCTSQIEA